MLGDAQMSLRSIVFIGFQGWPFLFRVTLDQMCICGFSFISTLSLLRFEWSLGRFWSSQKEEFNAIVISINWLVQSGIWPYLHILDTPSQLGRILPVNIYPLINMSSCHHMSHLYWTLTTKTFLNLKKKNHQGPKATILYLVGEHISIRNHIWEYISTQNLMGAGGLNIYDPILSNRWYRGATPQPIILPTDLPNNDPQESCSRTPAS